MCNVEIKEYAKQKNVKLWQIAQALNINDGNFSRKLRVEFTEEEKEKVKKIIDDLASNK